MNKTAFVPGAVPVYLLAAVLALSPLLRFSWDLWSQTGLHIALAAALVLFLVSRKPEFRSLPHGLLLIFFTGAALSLWHNPGTAVIRNELLVLLDALAMCFIFSTLPPERRKGLLAIPVLVGFFFSVILLFFTLSSYNGGYLEPDAIINRNVLGGYLTLAFPLSFLLWEKHGKAALAASAVLFAGIVLTHSRAAILCSSAAAGIFLWQRGSPRRILAAALPLLLAVLAYFTFLKLGQDSLGSRLLWWESAARIFLANPLNGAGWGNFGDLFPVFKAGEGLNTLYAHNLFLQVLAEGGLLAFLPFCVLLGVLLFSRKPAEPAPDRTFKHALYLSSGSFLAVNLFDYSLFIPAVMVLFFAVLGSAVPGGSAERERPLVPYGLAVPVIAALALLLSIPLEANRRYRHALYYLKHNDPDRAEQALRLARRLDPLPYQYYSSSAEAAFMRYARSKDPAALRQAVDRQREALDRFPVSGRLWADLSWLYLCSGDREGAIEAMRAAARNDRTTPRYRQALAALGSGKTAPGTGTSRHDQ